MLDVGCGTGWWLERLADEGVPPAALYGIDVQPERIRAATERVGGATFLEADARAIPLEADRFSAVTLFLTLSSLRDRRSVAAVLKEVRRVVAPTGCVLVWDVRVPNPVNPYTRRIASRDVAAQLGPPARSMTLTLLPPLARRVEATAYSRLSVVPLLHTHRMSLYLGDPK